MNKENIAKFTKNGNIKVGKTMWTFNKLAGGGVINGCTGSCGKHCTGCYNKDNPKKSPCYVFKSYNIYPSVIQSHIRNTLALRDNLIKAFADLKKQYFNARKKPAVIRIHASGELETQEEFKQWIAFATGATDTTFYVYTKAFDVISPVLDKMSPRSFPKNLYVNISVWHNSGVEEYLRWKDFPTVRAFVYDDGYDYHDKLDINCYCPAYDENGKLHHDLTCDRCKICFQSKAKVCACHSH